MARIRDDQKFQSARDRLLEVGERLIRANGYSATGISEILTEAELPKGSFYHYFDSKEAFGLAVAEAYNAEQVRRARELLSAEGGAPIDRLRRFFEAASADYAGRGHKDGCLMCNLSTELGDTSEPFRSALGVHWRLLSAEIAAVLDGPTRSRVGLGALEATDAADILLNSWSGALTRMKADGNGGALQLFLKTFFSQGDGK